MRQAPAARIAGRGRSELRRAIAEAAVPANTKASPASKKRRVRARLFASAINGSSENGTGRTCTVMALLSLAPAPSVKSYRSGVIPEYSPNQVSRNLCEVGTRLAAYDPRWPHLYKREVADVAAALAPVVATEHIGSTSVSGLAAKPTIDIAVGVKSLSVPSMARNLMETLGYHYGDTHGLPQQATRRGLWLAHVRHGLRRQRTYDRHRVAGRMGWASVPG
jgi:GrpB protein